MTNVISYTQPGYVPPKDVWIEEEVFRRIAPQLPRTCVDAIVYTVDPFVPPLMVLGKRAHLPWADWWIIGGRVLVTDESLQAALVRKLKEEVGLEVAIDRIPLAPVRLNYMRWADDGTVALAPAFIVRITRAEYDAMAEFVHHSRSSDFEELRLEPPARVVKNWLYHELLRDYAYALIEHLAQTKL